MSTNILEVAIKMEMDAIAFYKNVAQKSTTPVGKEMLLSVAKDESRHLEMLKDLFNGLDITMDNVNPMQDIKSIFETMKDSMSEKVQASADDLEAFKIGMEMEKQGIEFYTKHEAVSTNPKERQLLRRLIQEEEQHYAMFSNTYSFLSDTGNWFMWEEQGIVDGGTPWA